MVGWAGRHATSGRPRGGRSGPWATVAVLVAATLASPSVAAAGPDAGPAGLPDPPLSPATALAGTPGQRPPLPDRAPPAAAGRAAGYRLLGTLDASRLMFTQAVSGTGWAAGFDETADYGFPTHAWVAPPGRPAQALGTLGGASSQAWAVNDAGQVAGMAQNAAGLWEPFVATPAGQLQQLSPGEPGFAHDLDDDGTAVGVTWSAACPGFGCAFIGTPLAGITVLHPPGWQSSEARLINDAGWVAGFGTTAGGEAALFRWHPDHGFDHSGPRRGDSSWVAPVDVEHDGTVAWRGRVLLGFSPELVWIAGVWNPDGGGWGTAGGDGAYVTAVGSSADGMLAGYRQDPQTGHYQAFGWRQPQPIRVLGDPHGATYANGVTDDGLVLAGRVAPGVPTEPVLWDPDTGATAYPGRLGDWTGLEELADNGRWAAGVAFVDGQQQAVVLRVPATLR